MSQEQAVLSLLRCGPQTTHSFLTSPYGLGAEYRRALSTLRRKGYDIRAARVRKGEWAYRLVAEPASTGQMQLVLV